MACKMTDKILCTCYVVTQIHSREKHDKVLTVTDNKNKKAMIRIGCWTETCEMFCLTSTALVV